MHRPGYLRLMRLVMGFRESKILLVANDLDLFGHLAHGMRSAEELALELNVDTRALTILMNALVAMGILSKERDAYKNQETAERFLVQGQPDYLGQFLKMLNLCWNRWSDLAETLKPGYVPPKSNTLLEEERRFNQAFIWGMDNVAGERAQRIARLLDLGAVRRMLDLGGGAATYAIAFARQNPQLTAAVLDLPLAIEVARTNIDVHGLGNRIHTIEGSYWDIEYGANYDLVWISQVIHSLDERKGETLIAKAAKALSAGGRLIVHDSLLAEDGAAPYHAALFSALMLGITDEGRCYTASEVTNWLIKAGLTQVNRIELDAEGDLVSGIKK